MSAIWNTVLEWDNDGWRDQAACRHTDANLKDRESFDVADRLGLVWVWHGRVRVSQAVEYSLYPATHRHCVVPRY